MYSKVVISEALALFALPFVLYSFEVDGVSKIVGMDIKGDIKEISKIFSEVFFLRIFIFVLCLIVILLLSPLLGYEVIVLIYCWMLIPLSQILQSFWLFQGLENNAPAALFNFLSRLVCVGLIILLVRKPTDYYLVPIIIGLCYVAGGLLSLTYVLLIFKLRLHLFSFNELKYSIISGKEIFLGNLSVMLFRDSNVLILGYVSGDGKAIAAYSIAEKLIKGIQATMRPLNQLFFPKVVRFTKEVKEPNKAIYNNILRLTLPQVFGLLVLGGILFVGYNIVEGRIMFIRRFPNREEVVRLISIMYPAVLFGIANFMFGTAGLNHLNGRNYYFLSILAVGIISIIMCLSMVYFFGAIGASGSFLFSEVFLFTLISRKYFTSLSWLK
jgi:PST family polysaccharide transporter